MIPERGDFGWMSLDPQSGHEQKGRRPVLVISPKAFNAATGFCFVVPVTSRVRGLPFEVVLPGGQPVTGVGRVDQVKSLDFRTRRFEKCAEAPPEVLEEALALLEAVLF